jgi:hypothetical protein
VQSLDGFNS